MKAYEPSSKQVRGQNLLMLVFDFLHANQTLPSMLMHGVPYRQVQDRHMRRTEDNVILLQMTLCKETANRVSKDTPAGSHRAVNHSEAIAKFTPTRKTVLAPRWRANLKAEQQT